MTRHNKVKARNVSSIKDGFKSAEKKINTTTVGTVGPNDNSVNSSFHGGVQYQGQIMTKSI